MSISIPGAGILLNLIQEIVDTLIIERDSANLESHQLFTGKRSDGFKGGKSGRPIAVAAAFPRRVLLSIKLLRSIVVIGDR
jgi:hypothetical protein